MRTQELRERLAKSKMETVSRLSAGEYDFKVDICRWKQDEKRGYQ
jgi:hypothetical protein